MHPSKPNSLNSFPKGCWRRPIPVTLTVWLGIPTHRVPLHQGQKTGAITSWQLWSSITRIPSSARTQSYSSSTACPQSLGLVIRFSIIQIALLGVETFISMGKGKISRDSAW